MITNSNQVYFAKVLGREVQEEVNNPFDIPCHTKYCLSHIHRLKIFSLPALIPAWAMCSGVVFDTLTSGPRKSTPAS